MIPRRSAGTLHHHSLKGGWGGGDNWSNFFPKWIILIHFFQEQNYPHCWHQLQQRNNCWQCSLPIPDCHIFTSGGRLSAAARRGQWPTGSQKWSQKRLCLKGATSNPWDMLTFFFFFYFAFFFCLHTNEFRFLPFFCLWYEAVQPIVYVLHKDEPPPPNPFFFQSRQLTAR